LINAKEFERKYKDFERLDFANDPHTFHGFWSYKLRVEKQNGHLLDNKNINETLARLGPILRIWQWSRPYEFENCFDPFKKSVQSISDSYANVREFSLMEFDKAPVKDLERIWNALGSLKSTGCHGQHGELVMTITKPLMFLWGQTPAFDSRVREKMPSFNLTGFRNTRWEFSLWINVMTRLQTYLNSNAELVSSLRRISAEKYGKEAMIPYGQFWDLCYWTKNKDDNSENRNAVIEEEEETSILEESRQQREFRNLIDLLDTLKRSGKISADEWRDYSKQWNDRPQDRDRLIERLNHMK
jgi:hypothetical protein